MSKKKKKIVLPVSGLAEMLAAATGESVERAKEEILGSFGIPSSVWDRPVFGHANPRPLWTHVFDWKPTPDDWEEMIRDGDAGREYINEGFAETCRSTSEARLMYRIKTRGVWRSIEVEVRKLKRFQQAGNYKRGPVSWPGRGRLEKLFDRRRSVR